MSTTPKKTFTAHGFTWTEHTPGDPMPCDGDRKVFTYQRYEQERNECIHMGGPASIWDWQILPDDTEGEIIGWRYADEQPQEPPAKPASDTITDEQITEWMMRHDWQGSPREARVAIDDARSLHRS